MKFKIRNKNKTFIAAADKPEKENTPIPTNVSDKMNKRKFPEENNVESPSPKKSKKEKKKQPPIEENHADVEQSAEIIPEKDDVPVPSTKKSKKKMKKQSTIEESHVEEENVAVAIPDDSNAGSQNVKKLKKNKKNKPAIEEDQPVEVVFENHDTESQSVKKQKKKKKKKKKNQAAMAEDNEEEETPDPEVIFKSNEIESLFVKKTNKKNTEVTNEENGTEEEQGTGNISKKEGKHEQKNDLFKKKLERGNSTTGKKLLSHQIKAERELRTIFIGNLPVKFEKKNLQKLVDKYGEVETIRIRGAIPECDKISQKVATFKRMLNKNQQSLVAYARFKSTQDAQNALSLNGQIFEERRLRVTLPTEKVSDKNKGIFVGNLAFKTTDEELWDFFQECGEILSVRIIRDRNTGLCKGFGYVNFKSEDSVEFALKLNGERLQDREIRINRLFSEGKLEKLKKKKERNSINNNKPDQKLKFSNDRPGFNRKFKSRTEKNTDDKPGFKFRKAEKNTVDKPGFKPKKKNLNKVDLKKKKLAEKLLAKSKRPVVSS